MFTDLPRAMVRGALAPTVVFGAVLGVASAWITGTRGVLAVAAGLATVTLFFGATVATAARTKSSTPNVVMIVALLSYGMKFCVLAAVLASVRSLDPFDPRWFAVAAIGSGVVWLAGEMWIFTWAKLPTLVISEPPS
jgi:hypothetical protein